MRATIEMMALAIAWFLQASQTAPSPAFRDFSHQSDVLGSTRLYRVLLPPDYDKSRQRYPVVYWLHTEPRQATARDGRLAGYVARHELIVVDAPAVDVPQFALYFPELVHQVDATLRTVADRGHRAVAGFGAAGFEAYLVAGKYPDLLGSVSSIEGTTEGYAGPDAFPTESRLDELAGNYDGVRTRVSRSSADSLAFYHQRLSSLWTYTRPDFENVTFLAGQDIQEIDRTLDFHLAAFANPLPQPPVFNHADPDPNFQVWGWEVVSNRRQPGFTLLENVSNTGFRSSVREYLPGGATIPEVALSIGSPSIYPPGIALTVTYIHLLDGKVRRTEQRADAHGRLNFDLTGDAYEVAVSSTPLLTISGYSVTDANWATAGKPVNLKVRFWNKGGAAAGTSLIRWVSPNPGVKFATPQGRLYALAPGESANLPMTFTVDDPQRRVVEIVAMSGAISMPLQVPLFPAADPLPEFQLADGRSLMVFQHAVQKAEVRFGEGNGDGHAAPGESFAILVPDGGALRAAEVITNDACVENSMRGSDSWTDYDHSGASAKYSLPSIRLDCEPGHVVHMLARVAVPNGGGTETKYGTLEFPVWNRSEGK